MAVKLRNEWRGSAIFVCTVLAFASLFLSRAALSIFTGLLVLISFFHRAPLEQLRRYARTPLLWIPGLLWWIPFVSGAWSEDGRTWQQVMIIKLPLLLLPLAFASPFQFTRMQWRWLAGIFITLVTLGALWSCYQYLVNADAITESYARAKTVISPLQNDRVRFSWLVALAALAAFFLSAKWFSRWKGPALLIALTGLFLVFFLHLFAVRTGLFCFYLVGLAASVIWIAGVRKRGWVALLLLLIMPLAAYHWLPGFQKRFQYLRYEMDYALNGSYIPGGTDPVRIISLRAGMAVFRDQPMQGVGFGDVAKSVNQWYNHYYPAMEEKDRILPSSEYILYAAGAGIPGLACFFLAMFAPFFTRVRERATWSLFNLALGAGFLFDIGLEVQFGVIIYCFALLLHWKWQVDENL